MSNSTHTIETVSDLGRLVRRARKKLAGLRQQEAARLCGVSPPFLGKLENGGETVQLGKVLQVCASLGIEIQVRLPEEESPREPDPVRTAIEEEPAR